MDLARFLNEEQQKAVKALKGPVLVLAGAGSGKTRALTYRTARLIDNGVDPANILTLTFTNKAADDMKGKIVKLLGKERIKGMWLGTFHSICLRILRDNLARVNRSEGCLIYDTTDSVDIIEDIILEFGLDDLEYEAKIAYNIIQKAKMELIAPEFLIKEYAGENKGSQHYYQVLSRIYQEYERVLLNNNSFDFNDLIKKTIELFSKYPEILREYQNRFKYIQVDEYQDVNHAQYQITSLLSEPEGNIFVVGDDWQGIYGFRGADIKNILEFEKDYPRAEIIKLEQNYRSTNNIISVSNQLISNNKQNKEKTAWTKEGDGAPIFITRAKNPQVEAAYVARRINDLVNHYNYSYKDIAVLCRTHFQSHYIQQAFPRSHIPYQLISGVSFFDRQEIRYFINYLRLLVNPEDGLALKRLFRIEADGVGDVLLSEINRYAREHRIQVADVLADPTRVKGIGEKKAANLIEFKLRVLDGIRELRKMKMPFPRKALQLYELIDFENNVINELGNTAERLKYINFFMEDIHNYHKYNPGSALYDYLLINELLGGQDELEEDNTDSVKVMTAHSAKGLEFPVVFIIAVEEDVFPHQKSLEEAAAGSNPYAVEEERRLLYVAMTRAEKVLFMSFSQRKSGNDGEEKEVKPSRFLYELSVERMDLSSVDILRKSRRLQFKKDPTILKKN
ncbi:MAG: DNA helicase UvrD [Firmicutes bacterium]|nr:DNA helicase UvrD [Bacillota bacterium]